MCSIFHRDRTPFAILGSSMSEDGRTQLGRPDRSPNTLVPLLMGGMIIAGSGLGLIGAIGAQQAGKINKSSTAAQVAISALMITLGALTITGAIPVAAMGWTVIGSGLATCYSFSCSASGAASYKLANG